MAEITSFMLCTAIEKNDSSGLPILFNPLLELTPKYIPGQYSFGLCAGITGIDVFAEHKLNFYILTPDRKNITQGEESVLNIPSEAQNPERKNQGIMLTTQLSNLEITCEGNYILQIIVDGEVAAEHTFPVVRKV